jgi:hypothetical protein
MSAVSLKYMANPVTSTSVATNRVEDEAGPKPSRRKSSGAIQPASAPHITMLANATPNVMITSGQRSP